MENNKHSIKDYLIYIGAQIPSDGYGWRKIKCTIHNDKHASAGVNYDENRFKCHGCGVGGDIYDLIMYKEGGNYHEALKFAETISTSSNGAVRKAHSSSRPVSRNSESIGRRSQSLSFRSSERRSSRP